MEKEKKITYNSSNSIEDLPFISISKKKVLHGLSDPQEYIDIMIKSYHVEECLDVLRCLKDEGFIE